MGFAFHQKLKRPSTRPVDLAMTLAISVLSAAVFPGQSLQADDSSHIGPLLEDFDLTLESGRRTEAAGPFYYHEWGEAHETWALPPFVASTHLTNLESSEFTLFYPVLSCVRYGQQYRWHFCELLSFAGGPTQTETNRERFTVFPFYFQQRSSDPSQNYTAYGPFYGQLQHRLFRDEIHYVMFPGYSETRKADVVTDNYLFPFFHLRHGNGLSGWQFWPLVGHEHKEVTTRTNHFDEVETVPGHDGFFALWPLYFNHHAGLGSTNVEHQFGVIPAFSVMRSPLRDSTTLVWPFFSRVEDRDKGYREWDLPWPLIEFGSGTGKHVTRVLPFYSHAYSSNLVSDSYLWPIYKFNRIQSNPLDRRHTRILFFFYSDVTDRDTGSGAFRRRIAWWPFYSYHRDLKGNRRLQVLSIIEPFVPENPSVEREYAPVYSLWRSETNVQTGASSRSLLWNFYRRQTTADSTRCSFCFGLWQSESGPKGKRARLFYVPLGKPASTIQGGKQ